MILPILAIIQVMCVSVKGWNQPGLDEEINRKIEILDHAIDHEQQVLHIKDIKFISDSKAYIIYEVLDKDCSS